MREIWLHTNRRATLLGLLLPALLFIVAASIWMIAGDSILGVSVAVGLAILASLVVAGILILRNEPRLAYEAGQLLVYLHPHKPHRVPIEVVECFFGGQSPTHLPHSPQRAGKAWSIVVRLAEAARQWHSRDVPRLLGEWKDGYITIRGTWCEPIHPELVRRLNEKLVAAHRAQNAPHSKSQAS